MGIITALAFCMVAGANPVDDPESCFWAEFEDAPWATEAECRAHIARLEHNPQMRLWVETAAERGWGLNDFSVISTHAYCVAEEEWADFQVEHNVPAYGTDA